MLTFLIAASALAHIRAEYFGPRWQVYLFKPLTTTLILALTVPAPVSPGYRWLVAVGLVFSLAGDVFLMLPRDRFVPGLVSFLVAHLCYIGAFAGQIAAPLSPWRVLPLLAYGALFFRVLLPHAGRLKLPVLVYGTVILAMVWTAWEASADRAGAGGVLALVGALLFLTSDSVLAFNRFVRRFHAAQLIILGTYFAAQWLIARSVG